MGAISLKPSSKGVTLLIIVSVLVFFGCVLGYVAAAGKMRAASAELDQKEKQVEESKQMVQKLEESRLVYLDSVSQVRYLESSVSTQDYIPTLLKQIEHLGKSVSLNVLSVRPAPVQEVVQTRRISSGAQASEGNVQEASQTKANSSEKKAPAEKPYDELKITLELEGRYVNALEFLYKLTSFPKIIAVNSMEMAPGRLATSLGSPKLAIKMEVTAFVLKENRPAIQPGANTDYSAKPVGKGGDDNEAG